MKKLHIIATLLLLVLGLTAANAQTTSYTSPTLNGGYRTQSYNYGTGQSATTYTTPTLNGGFRSQTYNYGSGQSSTTYGTPTLNGGYRSQTYNYGGR